MRELLGMFTWNELATMATIVVLAISGTLWFNKQFNATNALVFLKFEELRTLFLSKLDYHEEHDDQRFSQMRNDIWELRVRNAAKDGLPPLNRNREEVNGG